MSGNINKTINKGFRLPFINHLQKLKSKNAIKTSKYSVTPNIYGENIWAIKKKKNKLGITTLFIYPNLLVCINVYWK